MKKYYQYKAREFEGKLRKVTYDSYLKQPVDITEDFKKENDTWERIYEIPTQNKAVSIVVFSSVDLRTNQTREKGKDAVRIVLKWKTKNGDVYKRVAKHLRIETLFDNLKRSLKEAKSQIFKLNYKEFSKSKDI